MLKIKHAETIDRILFDRLYSEAFQKISSERKRVGDQNLADAMFNELSDHKIIVYYIDNYAVGIASYNDLIFNDKKYMFHRYPTYGKDINGSRSWWYSEEFQQKNSEYVRAAGYAGVITLFNPGSPAGEAVRTHFGSFNAYYNSPAEYEIKEVFGNKLGDNTLPGGKCFVIDLI